jgi:D-psicose/D-tagatose/L-ribulose 3-epimerase
MKLAISNLAWDFHENLEIFGYLRKLNIQYIEGVISKIGTWENINTDVIREYKQTLDLQGLKIKSIQSIFFNYTTKGLHDTENILSHIETLRDYCKILGVKVMVLGSPNLRVMTDDIQSKLSDTFLQIDSILKGSGIELSIEPNMRQYGGMYFHNLNEIVDFIISNRLVNVKTMIDTHNLILEGYNPIHELLKFEKFINHIHVSEHNLTPLNDLEFHKLFSQTLNDINYKKIITFEVKKCENRFETFREFSKIYSQKL